MANELVQQSPDINWNAVFESLSDSEDGLVRAKVAYRIACGMPWNEAAEQVGVSRGAIAGWMKTDDGFRKAVELIRENLASFINNRMHLRVAQADAYADFLLSTIRAPGLVDGILAMDIPDGIKKELIKERGLIARKYLDMASGRSGSGTTIIGRQTQMTLNITSEAAKILLERNPDIQGEIIEGESETTG